MSQIRKLSRETLADFARSFSVHHGSLDDVLLDEGSVDHTVTDPPYDKRTQDNTRRGNERRDGIASPMPLGFDALTSAKRDRWARWIAHVTRRWALVFSDHESSVDWANRLQAAGMVYIRSALWVRVGDDEIVPGERPTKSGAPQFTGDRPAQGHEVIVIAHANRPSSPRLRWNRGGKQAIYTHPVVQGDVRAHTAQKPVELMRELVADFCDPGETIIDPFAGSGTTLVACKNLGIYCAGIELAERHASYAARRAVAAAFNSHSAMTGK